MKSWVFPGGTHKGPEKTPIWDGIYRLRKGVLICEIMGWGEQISFAEEARKYAESIGCKTFHLDLTDNSWPLYCDVAVDTDDVEQKCFKKEGPNENGVTFYGLKKEYTFYRQ